MKTKHIILATLVFLVTFGFSQKIKKEASQFEYIQLPSNPLNKDIKNYNSQVILSYEADIIAEKQKNKEEYDKATAEYPQKVKDAEDKHKEAMALYKSDMKEWDEKSTGRKIIEKQVLEEDNKPKEPRYSTPSEPYLKIIEHQKVFNKDRLASSYLKLDGYKKSSENALKITVSLFGFESLEPELKSKEVNSYNSTTKTNTKTNKYWYEISHRHPINLKIETPTGEILFDETLEEFNEYTITKTSSREGKYPDYNKKTFLLKLQNSIVESNMKYINEYINDNYGFPKKTRNTTVFNIKPKKHKYDDYLQAFESLTSGYKLLVSDNKSAQERINNAISTWEKILTESNPSDKKARINSDITVVTHINLAEAYFWSNNFVKAEEHLTKILSLEYSKKQKKIIEQYKEIFRKQKIRWEANN